MSPIDELENFYRSHRHELLACALSATGCPERAEDAVHEAFARLIKLRSAPRNLRAYVFRAVRNAAIDGLRRNGTASAALREVAEYFENGREPPGWLAERDEEERRAVAALLTLPEPERQAIMMHLNGGLKFREIAEAMEKPAGTVTTWYRRGIEKLRETMRGAKESER